MDNDNIFTVEELEERLEMEAVIGPVSDVEPEGWYSRCGYEVN
ncbi:hypothetical protein [Mangrovimicrobium sediminis]|nr:hypothetical protein [Haliea sp. SAOS-164]